MWMRPCAPEYAFRCLPRVGVYNQPNRIPAQGCELVVHRRARELGAMRNPPYTMLTRHDAVVRRVGRCEKPRGPSQDSLVGMRSATACVRPRVRLHDALEWRASVASVLVSDGFGCVMCTSSGVLVEHACDWLMVVRTYLRGQQHHHRPGRMTHRRGTAAAADVRRAAQCACCTCATVRVCNLELRRERKRARHGGLTWAADPIRAG